MPPRRRKVPVRSCDICHQDVKSGELMLESVAGWIKPRTQGGPNTIRAKKMTGFIAHEECVDMAERKLTTSELF